MIIEEAQIEEKLDIVDIIKDSEIGEIYFKEKNLDRIIDGAISRNEIHTLFDKEIVGFIWTKDDASFDKYPFLHLIAVKTDKRSAGYGSILLDYFENHLYRDAEKVFLMVGDFNTRAKRLYEGRGYQEVGLLPKFYCDRADEYLMMKEK